MGSELWGLNTPYGLMQHKRLNNNNKFEFDNSDLIGNSANIA